jgi:hypothetical protein
MKTPPKPAFWVTNGSPRNVTLADLALNIKAFTTVNLLDSRHYSYTLEQLIKSRDSGSIFAKRDKIKVRDLPPEQVKQDSLIYREAAIPSRERSVLVIEEKEYDELKVSEEDQQKQDELYAKENADLAEIDIQRAIANKKV